MATQPQAVENPGGGNMDRGKRKPPASFKGMRNIKAELELHKIPQEDIDRLTKKQLSEWRAAHPRRILLWEKG